MRHLAHRFLLVGAGRDDTHADRAFAFVDAANRQDGWWSTPLRHHGSPPVFVGWMSKPEYAFDLVADLHLELWPARFHFVLRGAVELPAGMAARQRLLDEVPIDEVRSWCAAARARELPLQIELLGSHRHAQEVVVEQLARQHVEITRRWTSRQAEIVRARRRDGFVQEHADRLGCSRQAVYQRLQRARHGELREIEAALRGWIALTVHDTIHARPARRRILV